GDHRERPHRRGARGAVRRAASGLGPVRAGRRAAVPSRARCGGRDLSTRGGGAREHPGGLIPAPEEVTSPCPEAVGRTTRGGLQGTPGGSAPFATPPGALRCRGPLPPLLRG